MKESRLPEKIQVARLKLMRSYPYISAGLLALVPVETDKVPTMAVDQHWRLYFNRQTVEGWTEDEIAGVLWHELMHLLSEHHDRARLQNAYHVAWNVATDAEINDDLRQLPDIELPEGCVYPEMLIDKHTQKPQPEGQLAETYYDGLDIQVVSCSCGSGQGNSDGSQSGQDQSSDGQTGSNGQDESGQASGQQATDGGQSGSSEPQDGQGGGSECGDGHHHPHSGQSSSGSNGTDPNCPIHGDNPIPHGSASGMNPGEWEAQESDSGDSGPRKVGSAEGEIIKRKVASDTEEAASKSRGTVPGFMERFARDKLRPQVPWRQVLRGAIRKMLADVAGAVDYVRTRPSRRQSAYGKVVMPALRSPTPEVAFAIDTSGSMGTKELEQALGEVKGVLQGLGIRDITVFAVDHAVGFASKIADPSKIKLIGGGGTDMGIAIEQAEKMRPRPDFLVIFTDGYTPWPATPPRGFKVIVVSTTNETGPEWAKTVHVKVGEGR